MLIFQIKGEEQVKIATKSSTPKSQGSKTSNSSSSSNLVGHDASGFSLNDEVRDYRQKTESYISQVQHQIVRLQHASGRVVEEEVWTTPPKSEDVVQKAGPSGSQKATSAKTENQPKSDINKSDYGNGSPPSAKRHFTQPSRMIPFSGDNQATTRFPVGDSVSDDKLYVYPIFVLFSSDFRAFLFCEGC